MFLQKLLNHNKQMQQFLKLKKKVKSSTQIKYDWEACSKILEISRKR